MQSPAELLQLSGAYWATCALHAAVKLDVFTPLADNDLSGTGLAAKLNVPLRGLEMLLDALIPLGLLTRNGANYRATAFAAEWLASSSPRNLRHIILHHQHLVEGWSRLDEAVRCGGPVRPRVSHDSEEQERESFLLGMFNLASLSAPKLASAIDFSSARRMLDLGGGPGTYAIHFCLQNPALEAVIFDLPTTRPYAEQTVARFNLVDRVGFVGGDFQLDVLPGRFDVVWLSHILHAESPGGCAQLLDKAVAALEPGGQLLVQDFILDSDRSGPLFPALFSLNMLLGTPAGKAYSETELVTLLTHAGLRQVEHLPIELPNGAGIMRGVKAQG